MITETMVHNSIEEAEKLIRQYLEKGMFGNISTAVLTWELLKDLEDKLKSGSFEEKEEERNFKILKKFYKIAFDKPLDNSFNKSGSDISDKRLEDMEVTIADDYYIFNEARALLKKYMLEDKRQQASEVAWLVSNDSDDEKIDSIYQKEFEKQERKQ